MIDTPILHMSCSDQHNPESLGMWYNMQCMNAMQDGACRLVEENKNEDIFSLYQGIRLVISQKISVFD